METQDCSSLQEDRTTFDMDLFNCIMQEPPDIDLSQIDLTFPSLCEQDASMHRCSSSPQEDCKFQANELKQSVGNVSSSAHYEPSESSGTSRISSEASVGKHELASDFRWASSDVNADAKYDANAVLKCKYSPQVINGPISHGFEGDSKHGLKVVYKDENSPAVFDGYISPGVGEDSKQDSNMIFKREGAPMLSGNHVSVQFGEDTKNKLKGLESEGDVVNNFQDVSSEHNLPVIEGDSKQEQLNLTSKSEGVSHHHISPGPENIPKHTVKALTEVLSPPREFPVDSNDHIFYVCGEDTKHVHNNMDHEFANIKQLLSYDSPVHESSTNEDRHICIPDDSKSNASSTITATLRQVGDGLCGGMDVNSLDLDYGCANLDMSHEYGNRNHCDESFVVDEDGCIQVLEDSKSNASSTNTTSLPFVSKDLPGEKVPVVDLISDSDSDSDCEEEITQSQESLHGKRTLPAYMGSYVKPSKALCLRDVANEGFIQCEAVKTESHYEGTNLRVNKSHLPTQNLRNISDADSNMFHPATLQNGGLRPNNLSSPFLSLPILSKENLMDNSSKRFLQVLDGRMLKDEPYPEDGLLTVPLLKHQRIAVAWMEKREQRTNCAGGILADDQGLGKTVSTIALILKAKPPAPSSSLDQSKQACNEALTVDLIDDDDDDDDSSCMKHSEWESTSETKLTEPSTSGTKGRPAAGTLVVCPTSVLRQWAQELKEKVVGDLISVHIYHGNNRVKSAEELAKHDVVLTTYSIVSLEVPKIPLTEEKEEADDRNPALYGLTGEKSVPPNRKKGKGKGGKGVMDALDDVRGGPLAKVAWFRVVLDEAQSIKNRRTQAARACWGLRAKRRWCLSGTPIQNTIDDLYSYLRFLRHEKYGIYKSFRYEIKDPISRNPGSGYQKLQLVLQEILLRRTKATQIDGEPIINLPKKTVKLEQVDFTAEERDFYTNLEVQSRKQFQIYAAAGTVQRNYVNILWMLLRLRQACDHPRLVKGEFSDAVESTGTECAEKLCDEKREYLLSVLERNCDTCGICSDAPEDAVITPCCHVFCRQCIHDRVSSDENVICPETKCQCPLTVSTLFSSTDLRRSNERMGKTLVETPQLSLKNIEMSSKIRAVINTLRALPVFDASTSSSDQVDGSNSSGRRTEKAIVFSQWTSMLDLLESSLKKEGFCYRRLDGTMSIQARDRALSDFKQLPDVTVIIMSLKAASLGLNMVTASHVLLIDIWWNPTTEDQAIDRAHRIGQTRDVHVSRFTVKNTIEDRILALQDKKRQMVASAFGEDSSTDQKSRLTVDEMSFLFRA